MHTTTRLRRLTLSSQIGVAVATLALVAMVAMARFSAPARTAGLIWISAALLLTTVGGMFRLLQSRYGLALSAMRDNPIAAESQGVDVRRLRFVVFVLAAAGSGFAGAVYIHGAASRRARLGLQPAMGLGLVFIVMVGGIGTLEGPIIGALIYFLADRFSSQYGATYMVALGIVTALVALYARTGAWGLIGKLGEPPWFPVRRVLIRLSDTTGGAR